MEQTETDTEPRHKGLSKGLYLIPSAFTAANICMGFLAVIFSLRGFRVSPEDAVSQPPILTTPLSRSVSAILFDTLDGRLARMTRTTTELGVQLDSLADVLTFGIAPVTLIYGWAIGASFPAWFINATVHWHFCVVCLSDVRCFASCEV